MRGPHTPDNFHRFGSSLTKETGSTAVVGSAVVGVLLAVVCYVTVVGWVLMLGMGLAHAAAAAIPAIGFGRSCTIVGAFLFLKAALAAILA
jgi:hypothetical protein